MSTSWTKGPWVVEPFKCAQNLEADCGVLSVYDGKAYVVARCPRYQEQAQWEADAKLIAAAPALAEALRQIADPRTDRLSDAQEIARAALAMAKGERG